MYSCMYGRRKRMKSGAAVALTYYEGAWNKRPSSSRKEMSQNKESSKFEFHFLKVIWKTCHVFYQLSPKQVIIVKAKKP